MSNLFTLSVMLLPQQMGTGGFGVWNACASPPYHVLDEDDQCDEDEMANPSESNNITPLFDAVNSQLGKRCGGQE